MMLKRSLGVVILAAFCLAAPLSAGAAKVDMGQLTCKDFTQMNAEELGMMYMWLDGYASHMLKDNTLDLSTVEGDLTTLLEHCQANPGDKILDLLKE